MAPSGKQDKQTGSRKAISTKEFKSAKTSPAMQAPAPDEPSLTEAGDAPVVAVPASEAPTETSPAQPAAKTASGKAKATTGQRPAVTAKTTSGARKAIPDEAAAPRAPRAPASGDIVWLICRECHEEWVADPVLAKAQETLACPMCDHRAQPPNDDILHQIALYKGMEKQNLLLGLIAFGVGCLSVLAWTLLTTNPERAEDFTFFTLPLIVAGLCAVATLFFLSKYENSRWETYF